MALQGRKSTGSFTIAFNLMSVPVKQYTAVSEGSKATERNQLHDACNTRLNQQMWCPKCEVTVPRTDIAKGYRDGEQYIKISDEEIKKLKENLVKDTFQVEHMVDPINPLYFEKTYELGADKGGDRAFNLFVAGLAKTKRYALGRVTLRDREQLACLWQSGGVLFLTTLYHGDEVRTDLSTPIPAADKRELALFEQLVNQSLGKFVPADEHDAFRAAFMELVERKRRDPNATVQVEASAKPHVADLLEALQRSLAQAPAAPKAPAKKTKGKKVAAH